MTKIVIAGTEYVVSDITDIEDYDGKTYKFVLIEGIRPDEAAEVIDIRLVFNKDEISHIEDTGYCVTDYFKSLASQLLTILRQPTEQQAGRTLNLTLLLRALSTVSISPNFSFPRTPRITPLRLRVLSPAHSSSSALWLSSDLTLTPHTRVP